MAAPENSDSSGDHAHAHDPCRHAYDILALSDLALRAAQDCRESGEAEPSLKRQA